MASAVNKVGYIFLMNRSCDGRMTSFLCEQSERVIFNGECWWSRGTLYIIPKLVIWASRALSAPSCQWAAPLLILFTSIRDEKNKMPLAAVCLWFPTTQCQLPLVPSSVACRLSLATLRLTSNPEKKCIGEPTLARCGSSSSPHFSGKCSSCSGIQLLILLLLHYTSAPGLQRHITKNICFFAAPGLSLHMRLFLFPKIHIHRSANWFFKVAY